MDAARQRGGPSAPNTATAAPVDGTFEYGVSRRGARLLLPRPEPAGAAANGTARGVAAAHRGRPFHKLEHLEDHVHVSATRARAPRTVAAATASCPHRSGVRPSADHPVRAREDLALRAAPFRVLKALDPRRQSRRSGRAYERRLHRRRCRGSGALAVRAARAASARRPHRHAPCSSPFGARLAQCRHVDDRPPPFVEARL